MKRAVLITGQRTFSDGARVTRELAKLADATVVIHGEAPGADTLADLAAIELGLPRVRVPYFRHLGRAGGPVRNRVMLEILLGLKATGYAVQVIAFFDNPAASRGTKNMVEQAKAANVPIVKVTI